MCRRCCCRLLRPPLSVRTLQTLIDEHDAVLVSVGSTIPRDLPIENRELNGPKAILHTRSTAQHCA